MLNDEAARRLGDQLAKDLMQAEGETTVTVKRTTKAARDVTPTTPRKVRPSDYKAAETQTTDAGFVRHVLPNYRGSWAAISHPDTPEFVERCRERHDGLACKRS